MDDRVRARMDLMIGSHECGTKRSAAYLGSRGNMALYRGTCDIGQMYMCLVPSGRHIIELDYYPRQNLFLTSRFDTENGSFCYTDSPFTPFVMGTLDFWKREDYFPDPDPDEVRNIICDRVGFWNALVIIDGRPVEVAAFMKTIPDILGTLDFDLEGVEPPEFSWNARGIMFSNYLDEMSDSIDDTNMQAEDEREVTENVMTQAAADMVDAPEMVRCVRFIKDYMDREGIPYMTPERQHRLLDDVSMRLSMLNMEVMIDMMDRRDPLLPE